MRHSRARPVTLPVTAVIVAGLLAACGSSSSTSSTPSAATGGVSSGAAGGAGGPANRAKLEACLKQHGVTLPSRPRASGSASGTGTVPGGQPGYGPPPGSGSGNRPGFFGRGGGGGSGGFRANPKLRAAFQACGAVRGGFGPRGSSALSHASIQKFVTCVRRHGYGLPTPNFSGKGAIFPAKIESNAKFQSASRACRSELTPSGGPPNGGAPPSGA